MYSESSIDLVKIALEYILLAIFFLLSIKVVELRNDYASSYNENQVMVNEVNEKLEFNKYDTGINQNDITECVTADEVIACIRNYRDGSIQVYVNKTKTGSELLLNSLTATTMADYFTQKSLNQIIDFNAYYHPYLIYDTEDITSYTQYKHDGLYVSGIAFIKVE